MQFKKQPRDLDTPLGGDSHGEMWATPRQLSVVTVEEGWWFPELSQVHQYQNFLSQSVSCALQCSFFVSPPWTYCTLLKSSSTPNLSLTWVMVSKHSAVTSKRPQHYGKMLPQGLLRASLKGLSAASYANCLLVFLGLFSLSSGSMFMASQRSLAVTLASMSLFLISLIWLLEAVRLLSLLSHLTSLHDFTVRLTCFVKMLHHCVAPETKQNSFCKARGSLNDLAASARTRFIKWAAQGTNSALWLNCSSRAWTPYFSPFMFASLS